MEIRQLRNNKGTHLCGVHLCKYCHSRTVHNVKGIINLHKCLNCGKIMIYNCTTTYMEKR